MRFSRPGRGGDPGLQLIGEDRLVSELRGENKKAFFDRLFKYCAEQLGGAYTLEATND